MRRRDIHVEAGDFAESWSWFCLSLHLSSLLLHGRSTRSPPPLFRGQPAVHAHCACLVALTHSSPAHPIHHITRAFPTTPVIMNGHANGNGAPFSSSTTTSAEAVGTFRVKVGLAQMLKGGVIMGTRGVLGMGLEGGGVAWGNVACVCICAHVCPRASRIAFSGTYKRECRAGAMTLYRLSGAMFLYRFARYSCPFRHRASLSAMA